jgi:hypothetical protein
VAKKHEKGVAIIMDATIAMSLLGWWALSDRVIQAKFKGNHVDITIILENAKKTM